METINTYYEDYKSLKDFVADNGKILLAGNNRSVLVQVFAGICENNYLIAISKQIRDLIPGAQVIGTTTNGEIMNGLVSGLKTVLSFSVFASSAVKVAFAELENGDDYELGRSIAADLSSDKVKVMIMFATGIRVNANQLLKGVQSVNAGLPIAGGVAGDNRLNIQRFVFCNDNITDCGVVAVALEGDNLTASCHSHLGWMPIGKEMTITKARGSRIYTIDNMPAFQVYSQYLGIDKNNEITDVIEFPLVICGHSLEIARSPYARYDDDSIGFYGDVDEGDIVRFSFGHVELIIEKIVNLLQIIKQQPVETIFIYSCASRRGFLQDAAQIETLPLQDIAATAGFFTAGEFFHAGNNNHLLNATMTTLALSETGIVKVHTISKKKEVDSLKNVINDVKTIKDNIADRGIEVLKSLTHLINTVTGELNDRTIELEKANQDLYLSEERFSKAFLSNPDPISITTIDELRYIEVNEAWLEYTSYGRDEVLGHTARELSRWAFPEDQDRIIEQIQKHGRIRNFENRVTTKSGELRTVLLSVEIIYMGYKPHLLFVSRDITDLKKAEIRLEEERNFNAALLDTAGDLIVVCDQDGRIVRFNKVCERITGYRFDDVKDKLIWDVAHSKEDIEDCKALFDGRNSKWKTPGVMQEYENHWLTRGGKRRLISWRMAGLIIEKGHNLFAIGTGIDITEQRIMEEQIRLANRELKDFAHIVSHDLKAPLRGIRTMAEWLYNDYKDLFDENGKMQLDMLQSRVKRMYELLEGVLHYSKLSHIHEEKTRINIKELISEVVEMLQPPDNVAIIIEDDLPHLTLERTRVQQIFENLIGNAIKYMNKPQGQIRIRCVNTGDFYQFSINDNGCGIEARCYDRIFTIFQTLKSRDEFESTGIGLTIVKKIVEIYGGKVWVESTVGEGSTFYFTLPVN